MTNFDRRQLRYFVAVAEELHFGRAARRLHISQPPLSQQIAALEIDLDVQLFMRNKRKVEITAAGEQFLHDARTILADMEKAAARARAAAAGQSGFLHIGLNYSAPIHPAFSVLIRKFIKLYPHVRLEQYENTSAKQLQGLLQKTLDLCFIWPTRDDASPDITILPLTRDELHLICAQDHPLARKPNLTASDLDDMTIFLTARQPRMNFYDALMNACSKAGASPTIRTDMNQLTFIMNVVAAGQGIAFVPDFCKRIKPVGTVFRPCSFLPKSSCLFPLSLVSRAQDSSPLVQNFVKVAREFVANSA